MNITRANRKRLRNFIFFFTAVIFSTLVEQAGLHSDARTAQRYICDDLICAIDLGDDMYGHCGLETGMNYEVLNRFAKDNRCSIKIITTDKQANFLDSLILGKIDILITHRNDSTDYSGARVIEGLDECSVWAINHRDTRLAEASQSWMRYMSVSPDFKEFKNRFNGNFNPHKRAEYGIKTNTISPYDDLFRKHAIELGWDWRLVAAVVYQESKFSINSRSARGATGLMQVMPKTGQHYGVDDLTDPEQNIIAGTSHLNRLRKMFLKWDLEPEELVKFTLAAYNAGEGRICDCRTFAQAKGYDSSKWDEIVKVIPMMRDDSILSDPDIRHGKFNGSETIEYIENVMSHYQAICQICPEK